MLDACDHPALRLDVARDLLLCVACGARLGSAREALAGFLLMSAEETEVRARLALVRSAAHEHGGRFTRGGHA